MALQPPMDTAEPNRPSFRRLGEVLVPLLLVTGLVAYLIWNLGAERRAIQRLPTPERVALYERTRQNLQSLCEQEPKPELRGYCRDQAAFIVMFPECDATCSALADRWLLNPRR